MEIKEKVSKVQTLQSHNTSNQNQNSKSEISKHKCNKQQVRVSNRKHYEGHKLSERRQQQTQTSNDRHKRGNQWRRTWMKDRHEWCEEEVLLF